MAKQERQVGVLWTGCCHMDMSGEHERTRGPGLDPAFMSLPAVSQPALAAQPGPGPMQGSRSRLGEVSFGMSQARHVALASEQV